MTRIAVYMTGGIAVYKAVQVVRDLEKNGHEVRVVMTKNAEHFVTSNTLAALTKYPVLDDLWSKENEASIPHVHLARWSELALVLLILSLKWQMALLMMRLVQQFWLLLLLK